MKLLRELLARSPLPGIAGGKDDKGNLVLIGGPASCPGAVLLAAAAALRVGSGRVQLVVDPTVATAVAVARPETMVTSWDLVGAPPDDVRRLVADAAVVVIGPGCPELDQAAVVAVAADAEQHVVLDAGALSAAVTIGRSTRCTIAPNPSEAARLTGGDDADEAKLAANLVALLGRPVAVRGERSFVGDPDAMWCFDDGPTGLGTPGSGDVFAGVLGGLLARGADELTALAWAVAIHARAGELLAATTPVGYLAGDVAAMVGHAQAELTGAELGNERRRAGDDRVHGPRGLDGNGGAPGP